jgi:hypothetical protein
MSERSAARTRAEDDDDIVFALSHSSSSRYAEHSPCHELRLAPHYAHGHKARASSRLDECDE